MLDATELAQIRTDAANAALDNTGHIQRKTITKDTLGQATETWATVTTCNVGLTEPTANMLANYNYRIEDLAAWHVKFAVGTDVQPEDHLLITGQFTQQTLVVQVILEPRSYAALLSVIASELKP